MGYSHADAMANRNDGILEYWAVILYGAAEDKRRSDQ